jgi:DNA-directed RNA polymerase subunit RPC12/RpoP
MRMRQLDRYRCDDCGFEGEVTRPTRRATSMSEETFYCCGRCGARLLLPSHDDRQAIRREAGRILNVEFVSPFGEGAAIEAEGRRR